MNDLPWLARCHADPCVLTRIKNETVNTPTQAMKKSSFSEALEKECERCVTKQSIFPAKRHKNAKLPLNQRSGLVS